MTARPASAYKAVHRPAALARVGVALAGLACAGLALTGLGGCAADRPPPAGGEPSMYASMATAEAELDASAAASIEVTAAHFMPAGSSPQSRVVR